MSRYSTALVALAALSGQLALTTPALAQTPSASTRLAMSLDEATRLTWRIETRSDGIAALRRIVAASPDDANAALELGRVLTWNAATRLEGIGLLRRVLDRSPHRADVAEALADVLAWDLATRDEAIRQLRALLEREPARTSARVKLADVLSWNPATRDEARALYQRVLADDKQSVDAAVGLARVLSWTGQMSQSRQRYMDVLASNPGHQSATVGVAELEAWSGRPRSSLKVLSATSSNIETPGALRLRAEAYSQIGRPSRAIAEYERLLAIDPANPAALQATRQLRRGLRPRLTFGIEGSTESGDSASKVGSASVPFRFAFHPNGSDLQLFVTGAEAAYRNSSGWSRDRSAGAGVDTPLGNRVRVSGELMSHQFERAERTVTGRGQVQLAMHDRFDMRFGIAREQLSSSRLSLVGEQVGGTFYGPSFVDQVLVGASARASGGFDAWVQGTAGRIRGLNIARNARQELFAGAGKSFDAGVVTLRSGYSLTWIGYDRDLGGFPRTHLDGDGISAPGVGGYFSPRRFVNHTARIDATVPLGTAVLVVAGSGVGRQYVAEAGSFGVAPRVPSSDAYLGVRAQLGDRLLLSMQANYQDVASAFNRTAVQISASYGF